MASIRTWQGWEGGEGVGWLDKRGPWRSRRANRVLSEDVVREAAARMGCYMTDARRLLNLYCELVGEALAAGKAVQIRRLGVFKPVPGRRVQTVRFVAAKALREAAARAPVPAAQLVGLAEPETGGVQHEQAVGQS